MTKNKLLSGIIIALTICFIVFEIFQLLAPGGIVRGLIFPLLTILYCITVKSKSSYFFCFLLFYSIVEFTNTFTYFTNYSAEMYDVFFYSGNLCYIIAYVFLILEILKSIHIKTILNRFAAHLFILLVVDVYCIYLVSEIAVQSELLSKTIDYISVVIYNTVIMLFLTVALINYLSRDSKKAMNLLLGALCIVFSEIIQIAYFYVSDKNILSVTYSVLLIFAFYFLYIQSKMSSSSSHTYESLSVNNIKV